MKAKATDIIYTAAVSGIPANFMKQSLEKAGVQDVGEVKSNKGPAIKPGRACKMISDDYK